MSDIPDQAMADKIAAISGSDIQHMQSVVTEHLNEKRDEVVEAVRADLLARSRIGITKYGMTLSDNTAVMRERLQHAYEEALDLANYLKWSIMQLDGDERARYPIG